MSIASWTDADGSTRWADTDSKAYRNRVEAAPAKEEPAEVTEAFIPLAESKRLRATPKAEAE